MAWSDQKREMLIRRLLLCLEGPRAILELNDPTMASFWLQACPIIASFYMAVQYTRIRQSHTHMELSHTRMGQSHTRICPDILYTRVWDCIFSYMHACLSGAGCTRSACCTYNYIGTCMQYCMDNLNVHGTVQYTGMGHHALIHLEHQYIYLHLKLPGSYKKVSTMHACCQIKFIFHSYT